MADFKKSVDALQFIKELSMPQQAGKIVKASDAYAPFADQGIFTAPTMADRTIASPKGKLKGGMRFPYLQNVDPAYEGEVWGFGAGNMSTRLLNQFENVPSDKLLLSTILGNKYMHHSNPEVSAELIKQYRKGIKDKKLSNELRDVTNRRINQLTDEDGLPIFAPDSDVTDPAFYRSLDTFDKRAAMGNIMGGVGLNEGTERKRRVANQIFDYEGLMRKMTEPSIIGAPNSSIGSRIFTLSGTKSERPDLNKAYPHVVGGLDLNVDFGQVPFQHYLKDYTDNMMRTRGKVPGWFNLTRSSDLPTQEITDQWLQHLKNQGYADGGEVEHMQAGGVKKAISALGELTTASRTPTVYEIAHQVAQRNAAKPVELGGLGLHADNTAMDRAKALGFEHQTYHGTDSPDIQAFDPSKTKMWNAIFSSTDPKQASDYSRLAVSKERAKEMGHESSPNVMPLMLRNADYATPEYLNPASIESARRKGKAGLTHDSWAITLDPATIRSRFAAFDPAELSSPEILKAEGGKVEHMQAGGVKKAFGALSKLDAEENLARWLSGSPIRTESGDPKKLFHITTKDFDQFRAGGFDPKISGHATWLTDNPTYQPAAHNVQGRGGEFREGTNVMPVYSNAKNPLMLDDQAMLDWAQQTFAKGSKEFPEVMPKQWADEVKDAGYGYIHLADPHKTGTPHEYIMLEPERQLKSAIGNRGTYDPNEPSITKAEGGSVEHMQAGGLKTLMGEVLNKGGTYAARRLQRAADEIPNLEKLFQEQTLQRAFLGDNDRALMTMRPSEFENYAEPLLDLSKKSRANIANLKDIQASSGFTNMPFLMINKENKGSLNLPFITAHEGRHRSRAMDAAGEQASLVQLFPRTGLRESFPRGSEQEYIEALRKEMALTGNKVMPEKYYESVKDPSGRIVETRDTQRPAIDLPDIYAEGGVVHKQVGGAMKLLEEFKALKAAHEAAKATPKLLPQNWSNANLARFLEESKFPRGYHGTSSLDEHTYEPSAITRFNDHIPVWAAKNPKLAEEYAGESGAIYPLHISAKNPLKLDVDMNDRISASPQMQKMLDSFGIKYNPNDPVYRHVNTSQFREGAEGMGHDAVLANERGEPTIGVFSSAQLKSTTGNRGTYDPNMEDIGHNDGGAVHSQAEDGDIMRQLFDHALDKGDIHEMTHAMLVKQHEAEYG